MIQEFRHNYLRVCLSSTFFQFHSLTPLLQDLRKLNCADDSRSFRNKFGWATECAHRIQICFFLSASSVVWSDEKRQDLRLDCKEGIQVSFLLQLIFLQNRLQILKRRTFVSVTRGWYITERNSDFPRTSHALKHSLFHDKIFSCVIVESIPYILEM